MKSLFPLLLATLVCSFAIQLTRADDELPVAADREVDFAKNVFPLLSQRCFKCHGPEKQEGELRLDAKAIVVRGGISGELFEPGKSGESRLIRRLVGLGDEERMPPEDDGPALTDEQIGLIRAWIDQGAKWPDGVGSEAKSLQRHWAYVAPIRPPAPDLDDAGWARGDVDRFLLEQMRARGLKPSPPAERARLLRRVSLDLTGLPPTIAELDTFLADTRADAYERAVDRLLRSPRYGEHWARPWLDLARYADSNGYQADQLRDVWPYRDWVIAALNADMPYDQFTLEQLAGDLLPNATVEQKIASGFHRLTTCNVEAGVDPEENRVNQVIDRVNVTGTVWLGTSIECSQCHNHKYDPFTQRDYYGLFAFFNSTPLEVKLGGGTRFDFVGPKMTLPLEDAKAAQKHALLAEQTKLSNERKALAAKIVADQEAAAEMQQRVTEVWRPLKVATFKSAQGADHEVLADDSILVTGDNPDTDTYTITIETKIANVRAFKLEALLHDSLPDGGPGRQTDRSRANFVLNEFVVEARRLEDLPNSKEPNLDLSFQSAMADYANPQYPAEDAIDGDPATGWAIHEQFHRPHHAIFTLKKPVGTAEGLRLTFRITQSHGGQRTLGRFRLLASTVAPGDAPIPIPMPVQQALAIAPEKRRPNQQQAIDNFLISRDPQIKKLDAALAKLQKQLAALTPDTTLVMVEMDEPRDTHVLRRGDFLQPGDTVRPSTPRALHAWRDDLPRTREGLARWLTDRQNPLVARVAVNRWWAEIFGAGLLTSLEDFGAQGDPPTHPELLDWLAVEFMEHGWSQKHVLRSIVTSAAYRQDSRVAPEQLAADPYNKWLARGPRFRLSAEAIRDSGLLASGLLSTKMGGPPIYPPQPDGVWRHVGRNAPLFRTSPGEDRHRRGVYVVWRRSAPYASFVNFDAPDRAAACIRRPRTNTPLQALTLLNDPAYIEMAFALAQQVLADLPEANAQERTAHAWRRVLSRSPDSKELARLTAIYLAERQRFKQDPQKAQALLAGRKIPAGVEQADYAAWFYVASILLNLDEAVTKG
jgi:hypothetical protein